MMRRSQFVVVERAMKPMKQIPQILRSTNRDSGEEDAQGLDKETEENKEKNKITATIVDSFNMWTWREDMEFTSSIDWVEVQG